MGGQTVRTSDTRLTAMQLQSSARGVTIPWIRGVTRVAPNLVWFNGFKATKHTKKQGGKGGGGVESTSFTYSSSLLLALGHGPFIGVGRAWKGKEVYAAGPVPSSLSVATDTYTVPASGAMVFTLSQAAAFVALVSATVPIAGTKGNWTAQLTKDVDYEVSAAGQVTVLRTNWRGATITFKYQVATATIQNSALEKLGLSFHAGQLGGPALSVTTPWPAEALGYSGLSVISGQAYPLTSSAGLENHLFEVIAPLAYHLGPTVPDVDPSLFVRELLLDDRAGAGLPPELVGDFERWGTYCVAAGLLVSPALTEQTSAAEVLTTAAALTASVISTSGGRIEIIPRADAVESGNGVTYTPDLTPVYDLDDECYTPVSEGDSPVKYRHKSSDQRYNTWSLEYRNRANGYSTDTVTADDAADIATRGVQANPSAVQANWICEASIARRVVQLQVQQAVSVLCEYEVPVPPHFSLIDLCDILTLTEPTLRMDREPVFVTGIDEDADGNLTILCDDYPIGSASAPLIDVSTDVGHQPNFNAAPGPVNAPVFVEAPVTMTETGLEVMVAVSGSGPDWGGANVWVSLDGTNYKLVARQRGGSRYGALTAPVGSSAAVTCSEQLLSGSAADAQALATLCWIGGAAPEFVAYTTATLTGAGAYALGGLVRGAYGTTPVAHQAGDPFVRVDEDLARSGPLDLSLIGKTLFFKFTSVNVMGAAEEALSDVAEYQYVVRGYMAKLPPTMPTGLAFAFEPYGVRLSCRPNPEPDVVGYRWLVGETPETAQLLDALGGTSYLWAVQAVGTPMVWCAAVDALGNVSEYASLPIGVVGGAVNVLTAAVVGADLQLDYSAIAGAFAVAGYEIAHGVDYATRTVVGRYQVTRHVRAVDWGGQRRWWVTPIDANDNLGTPKSVDVVVTPPGVVTSARSEVIDNNALLFWGQPATGSLPIDRYEVRKGATWEAGTVVGSNGNSTFASIFEQASGLYRYQVAAVDSAGNVGAALAIPATINQPPDYVLRVSIDSPLAGTLTNLVREGGAIVGPVDTSQTWASHFTSRGWASPADQVAAGYPLYLQPSAADGSYDEVFDYGVVLAATTITVTPGYVTVAGAVSVSVQIYTKAAAGDAWIAAAAGASSVFATGFRYVRVRVTVTPGSGAGLVKLASLNVKLANKLKTDSGAFVITDAAAGAWVPFGVAFVDADTPVCQPAGATPLIPVVDFSDVPNPTGFRVYLFTTSGVKVTGSGSWTARGY